MAIALVVDDSSAVRMFISRTLQQVGFEVLEAANGREALEVIEAQNAVTLVLADWNMPEVGGLELLTRLRKNPRLSSLVIIMVSGDTDQTNAALKAGANEYVLKPFTREMLVEKLESVGIRPCPPAEL